ncbi:MAG TPA: hypothetical protein VGT61_14365 [Thermomicrobiales bacterium]|nr:hypothetical protein [Thermomicrobiales bacterium]
MAHLFVGNQHMVDREVLRMLSELPDDFRVYGEFDCNRRNVDWLVIRIVPDDRPAHRYSTVILTELKRTEAQLAGGEYGRWTETRNGIVRDIVPGNAQDENYWRQLINTVNQFRAWLFANQPRFMEADALFASEQDVKVWPNLLVVSPPDIQHRLPLVPVNRFGAFHFSLRDWCDKLVAWSPREGLRITAAEADRLAEVLGLQPVASERPPDRPMTSAPSVSTILAHDVTADPAPAVTGTVDWLNGLHVLGDELAAVSATFGASIAALDDWVADVERRISRMEQQLERLGQTGAPTTPAPMIRPGNPVVGPSHGNGFAVEPEPTNGETVVTTIPRVRTFPSELAELVTQAIGNVRMSRRRRDFPTLGQELSYLAGPSLRESSYFGYGTLRGLLDEAAYHGLIVYGPIDGNAPSIYLPDEVERD